MLVATPYMGLETHGGPPRIISEIKKASPVFPREHMRPRISGELLVLCGPEEHWWPRRVIIRAGQLLVMSSPGGGGSSLRLPLRHLSIAAGPLPNSLTLRRGIHFSPVLALQATNEREFDLWVKTIAIELIRQTPLDAVKYFDILTLANCWTKPAAPQDESSSTTGASETDETWKAIFSASRKCTTCYANAKDTTQTIDEEETTGHQDEVDFNRNVIPTPAEEPPQPIEEPLPKAAAAAADPTNDKEAVDMLLKKCQNAEDYVPVKEKLMLFESLCRLSRLVRSSEDLSGQYGQHVGAKRTQSMHDLSNCFPSTGVRKICQYFETKTDTQKYNSMARGNKNRRLINSDSQLNVKNVSKNTFRFTDGDNDVSFV